MKKCKKCGGQHVSTAVLPEYNGNLVGAPFSVTIEGAVIQESCGNCGIILSVGIPNLQGLIAAIAMTRAMCPQKLNGQEIRFLRAAAGCKAAQLAEKIGVDPATVSRWETGVQPISESYEKHLRLFVCVSLWKAAPLADFCPEKLVNLKIDPARSANSNLALRCWPVPSEAGNEKWSFAPAA